ncbi:hypothetical protein L6452_07621 [Arctium lappa]|uniref:Uncharacterized protein n=1 Tax=Arctium lappa TaxID=4217 RepID=A0ACB9EM55_ARCLA|nr:hypothetical protein L6452_07621 [Arctium lappa]
MAMAYTTSSSVMFTTSLTGPSSLSNNNNRSLILFGFSTMTTSASSPKNIVGVRTNRNFQIRCKDQKVQQRAFAPVEQRWMFTDSDFTGSIRFFSLVLLSSCSFGFEIRTNSGVFSLLHVL